MKAESDRRGKRLLDALDVHYYPQGRIDGQGVSDGKTTSDALAILRVRSTRCLWDKTYKDESWINQPVMLIPRVRAWIDQYNHGYEARHRRVQLGRSRRPERGRRAGRSPGDLRSRRRSTTLTNWSGLDGNHRFAFRLYRNPDGHHKGFGNRYLPRPRTALDRISSFAALRDDGATTSSLVNKDVKATG